MKYFAVIDTNVIISAMLNFQSVPGQIVLEALTGKIIPLLNDEILAEYEAGHVEIGGSADAD